MKLISKNIDKHRAGKITIIPENDEDMWISFNLLENGDKIRTSTLRKVQTETSTGSVNVKQVRTYLTIEIEAIDYDSYGSQISVKGKNVEENEYVKLGAYHSFCIIPHNKFSLWKEEWDTVALDLVRQCTDVSCHADLAAVIMQEGLAYICLITNSATVVRCKIDINIPQKRKGVVTQRDKAVDKFIDLLTQAIEKHINFEVVKCVILASPGFLKEKLLDHINKVAFEKNIKVFQENKGKFLLVHSSTGHKSALKEVLMDPIVQSKAANTKASSEVQALQEFFKMLKLSPNRAFYGEKHIDFAHEMNAIDTLLISDSLFRNRDHSVRRKFVDLVDSVKNSQGTVRIFSSCHPSGEQLNNLTGIAAILRFPIDEPVSDDSDESDEDNEFDYDYYHRLSQPSSTKKIST